MIKGKAYAAQSASAPLAPFDIERRDPGPDDVQIQILTAACATPTCTPRATSGGTLCIRPYRDTRSSAA